MDFLTQYNAQIAELCRKYNVRRLYAFGSVLTDRFNAESDIDFIVDFDKKAINDLFLTYFDFKYSLEDVFGRKVDLLEEQPIRNSYLRKNIENSKVLIYGWVCKKHLEDILISIDEIDDFFDNQPKRYEEFTTNLLLRRAIERNIEVIGEAMSRILKSEKDISITNARKIVDTRNYVIHGYDSLLPDILWSIVMNHLPLLKKEVEELLEKNETDSIWKLRNYVF